MELLDIDIRLIFAILSGKVSAAIYRRLMRNFHNAGLRLTPEHWVILLYLSERDGVAQQHLCEVTFKDKPAMTRLIDTMECLNLVERVPCKADRRANLVYLTHVGRDVQEQAQSVALKTLRESLRGLSLDDLRVCQEVLRTIFENMKD